MGLKVIIGTSGGRPITRTITHPDHARCIHAMIEIESRQPFDMERQQYRGRHLIWGVIEDDENKTSTD